MLLCKNRYSFSSHIIIAVGEVCTVLDSYALLCFYFLLYAGLKFWKTGSRKIFAVKEEDVERLRGKGKNKRSAILFNSDEDEDSDEFATLSGKLSRKRKLLHATPENGTDPQLIMKDLAEIKKDLKSVLALTPESSIPLGLKRIMMETFQCSICMSPPVVPPVIYARCCKRLLGCQACVDTWYGGEEGKMQKCPICRSERAFADTALLKGFDDFFQAIALILGKEQDETASVPEEFTNSQVH